MERFAADAEEVYQVIRANPKRTRWPATDEVLYQLFLLYDALIAQNDDSFGKTVDYLEKEDLLEDSLARKVYGTDRISERHRHRYEVNQEFLSQLEQAGMRFSGLSPDGELPEIVENPAHPWFLGVQFHPELKSKPYDPHPLFTSFIEAAVRTLPLLRTLISP